MKQQIVCPACKGKILEARGSHNPYPGEHIKFVPGRAKIDLECDHCAKEIDPGDPAFGYSIWMDHGAEPYYKWEDTFLDLI